MFVGYECIFTDVYVCMYTNTLAYKYMCVYIFFP